MHQQSKANSTYFFKGCAFLKDIYQLFDILLIQSDINPQCTIHSAKHVKMCVQYVTNFSAILNVVYRNEIQR